MSSRREHALIGLGAGIAVDWLVARAQGREPAVGELLLSGVLGAGVALLPDRLEPALDPWHRGVFHSVGTLTAIAYLAKQVMVSRQLPLEGAGLLMAALGGYSSHLVADSRTPSGLPLLK